MKAFYNLEDLNSISILDVCQRFGVPIERRGSVYFCKLRSERTASCKLYLNNADGHDSFYDFGSSVGGNVIKFVSECLNCNFQTAIEELANAFNVEPVNNSEYFNRNELTDLEWQKIGVYGDLATKNFDFDLDKFSYESTQKYAEKYSMSVNQLRREYPYKYAVDIIKKRAIPHVYSLRNNYYFHLHTCLYLQKSLLGHFDINNVPQKELEELNALHKELTQSEALLKKALRGTDVIYTFKEYNVLEDLKKIYYGEIAFEIGEISYVDVKRESQRYGTDLRYRSVSLDEYLKLADYDINSVMHAAFVKNENVNIAFLPDQSELIDELINLCQKDILEKQFQSLCDDCIDVLHQEYNLDVSSVDFLGGMDRVQKLTRYFLTTLKEGSSTFQLSDNDIELYSFASMFHDTGKFLVDKNILNKPGKLTPEEFEIVKKHSEFGFEILSNVKCHENSLLEAAKKIAYEHHERWDGNGYPNGLKGKEIPLEVQAAALADVYNALRSKRPYKEAFSHSKAVELIKNGECGAFNPILLECLDERDCFEMCGISELKDKGPLEEVVNKAENIKQPSNNRDNTVKGEINRE